MNKMKRQMSSDKSSNQDKYNDSLREKAAHNEYIRDFIDDKIKYKKLKSQIPLKGSER